MISFIFIFVYCWTNQLPIRCKLMSSNEAQKKEHQKAHLSISTVYIFKLTQIIWSVTLIMKSFPTNYMNVGKNKDRHQMWIWWFLMNMHFLLILKVFFVFHNYFYLYGQLINIKITVLWSVGSLSLCGFRVCIEVWISVNLKSYKIVISIWF